MKKEGKKNIITMNSIGELHGYQEIYDDGKLRLRAIIKKHMIFNYMEYHSKNHVKARFHIR